MATKIEGHYSGEGNRLRFFDPYNNHESALVVADLFFKDDFIGKGIDVTNKWTLLDTAGATETLKADQPGGVVELALTNAVEIQLGGIYMADEKPFTLNRGLNFESRIRFTTLPADAATAVIGLSGDTDPSIDTIAESCWFRLDGSGAITVEHDDTANTTSKVSTGVTLIANEWAVLRIDCSDITNVLFFINGDRVAAGTTFDMSTVAALQLQPMVRMDKAAAGTNLGVMEVDYIACWQNRS